MAHTMLIPDETRTRLVDYLSALRMGEVFAGNRLRDRLADTEMAKLTETDFLAELLNTKPPQIFAESAVRWR